MNSAPFKCEMLQLQYSAKHPLTVVVCVCVWLCVLRVPKADNKLSAELSESVFLPD